MCVIVLLESFTFADKDEYEYKILSKYYVYVRATSFWPKKCDSCCHSTTDFSSKNKLSNVRSFNILLSGKGFKPPSILTVLKFLVKKK